MGIRIISSVKNNIRDIYDSRNILRSLISKELFGHYRNSILGFGWHFVMPVILMAIYYVVFTAIRQNSMPDFWIYIASALFPFSFMMSNLTGGAGTIVGASGMVRKMYFPREIIVLSKIISSFIIMLMGYAVILVIVAITGHSLELLPLMIMPEILVLMGLFATGYCLFFSSITVYIRDVQYVLSSISIAFFFCTPMYFSMNDLSGLFAEAIWINPFVYYVEAFHQIVYYGVMPDTDIMIMCAILPVVSLIIGYCVFNKLKRGFAERL